MKININKSVIENMLIKSQNYLGKDLSSLTSQFNIIAENGSIVLNANNGEMGISSKTDNVSILEDGNIIVNGQKLISIIKAFKNDEITLSVKDEVLTISQSRSRFKMPLYSDKGFISDIKTDGMNKLVINYNEIVNSLRLINHSIDNNNPKYELNGAYISINDGMIDFASTDTRRLSLVSLETKTDSNLDIIIPKKAIAEMQKVLFDDVELFYSDDKLIIMSDDTKFFTKLINGKFPDYKRIVPTSFLHEFSINKLEISSAIKHITAVSNEIKMTIRDKEIEFESLSNDKNEAKTLIELETGISDDVVLCVNATFFMDFLNTIKTDDFIININDGDTPFVVRNDELKSVIMPIVI